MKQRVSKSVTEEFAVLLKYGTKQNAILHWWGKTSNKDNDWERRVVQQWVNELAKTSENK